MSQDAEFSRAGQRLPVRAIAEMGIVVDDAEEVTANLAGGERKALAISRSLYFGVRVLMPDEPTAALSAKETHTVLDLIEGLEAKDIATVFLTHNIHHAYTVSDRFIALNAGRKVLDVDKDQGSPDELTEAVIGESLPALAHTSCMLSA